MTFHGVGFGVLAPFVLLGSWVIAFLHYLIPRFDFIFLINTFCAVGDDTRRTV
jgi:hypothetical protein